MLVSDFDYNLPEELIAQHPTERREMSRMLALDRVSGQYELKQFTDFQSYLRPGDCLVLNDTKVIPARLWGHRAGSGGRVQAFMLEENKDKTWKALLRPGRRLSPGSRVELDGDDCGGFVVVSKNELDGTYNLAFDEKDVLSVMEKHGKIPLPPYINRNPEDADFERYQTVYAQHPGAVAAPTAGLHFTPEILKQIEQSGVKIVKLTLHVGAGTFKPVSVERVEDHVMHEEAFILSPESAAAINQTHDDGHRVFCVGTTTVRVLETCADEAHPGHVVAQEGRTKIFLYPPKTPKVVDCLLTNFHLPKSTLLMLVCTFCDYDHVMAAYKFAVEQRLRFFSYGDCMLLHKNH
jgi:S-adenosylmethionine:tRNA ribosyltransferase-isomerase